jgi:hypothetical protein
MVGREPLSPIRFVHSVFHDAGVLWKGRGKAFAQSVLFVMGEAEEREKHERSWSEGSRVLVLAQLAHKLLPVHSNNIIENKQLAQASTTKNPSTDHASSKPSSPTQKQIIPTICFVYGIPGGIIVRGTRSSVVGYQENDCSEAETYFFSVPTPSSIKSDNFNVQ